MIYNNKKEKTLLSHIISFLKSEKILFLFAGGINTLIGLVAYSICIAYFHLDYRLSSFISLALGMIAGFLQSRHGIFQSGNRHSLKRYLVMWSGLYLFSIWILGMLITSGLTEIQAYIILIPISVPISFLVQKYWVFRPSCEK